MRPSFALAGVIAFSSGILAGSLIPIGQAYGYALAVLGIALTLVWLVRRRPLFLVSGVMAALFATGLLRVVFIPSALPEPYLSSVGQTLTLRGTIAADPDLREDSQRVTVLVMERGVRAKVLAVAPLYPMLRYGQTVTARGTLTLPEAFDTDGGRTFDYPRFLAKDGIFALIQPASVKVEAEPAGVVARVMGSLYSAKHLFTRGLMRALPEPASALAAGIITGGKQGLGDWLLDAFTDAGLLPIVVLSGYNVMIIAEAVLRSLTWLPKRTAVSIAGLVITLFCIAAGGGTSAVRAGFMAGLALFARATGRTYDALRSLVAAFALMLLLNPLSLAYDPGFQFSFMATLGLILLSSPIEARLGALRSALLREVLASTLAAQLFVLPLLLYQTGNLSLVSVPANLLVLPIVPLAMLLSFVAGMLALSLPPLATLGGLPAYAALSYVIGVAEAAASLPLASVIVPRFPFLLVVASYALIAWLTLGLIRRMPAPGGAGIPAS